MSTIIEQHYDDSVITKLERHPAWHGRMSGLKAEKKLRNRKQAYLYLLRAGELENDYYVTFTLPDLSVKHQPFTLTLAPEGWYYENHTAGGPYTNASIDDVIHLIMHCNQEECSPLNVFDV